MSDFHSSYTLTRTQDHSIFSGVKTVLVDSNAAACIKEQFYEGAV